jgi:RNA polymerase sigma-70 factor (ECF subfamily)
MTHTPVYRCPAFTMLFMSLASSRPHLVALPSPEESISERAPRDAAGIEALFREHAPTIASLGLSMLRNSDEANDLVQDVFLRAWDALDRLTEPGNARPWLITIAVRLARTRLRRRRLTNLLFRPELVELDTIPAVGALPEHRDLLQKLDVALSKLPANEQLAWILRHVHGEKIETVATLCGCSTSAVKRRLEAARAQLSKTLRWIEPTGVDS